MLSPRTYFLGIYLLFFSVFSSAATISINVVDEPGEGFNDPTAAAPVGGNEGTTIGQQRLNLFEKAAEILGAQIESDVTIVVDASFDPLFCEQRSATLGEAGPKTVYWNFAGVPTNTVYPQALANSIIGRDISKSTSEISARFNSNINGNPNCMGGDTWYYGFDEPTSRNQQDLLTVVLHELLHGLGFLSLVNSSTGAKYNGYLDDAYSNNLKDRSTGKAWSQMNNAERLTSRTNTGNLVWTGADVNSDVHRLTEGVNNSEMQMYAPSTFKVGSSVSHFDSAATPDEVMEPVLREWGTDIGLALNLLKDIGWTLTTRIEFNGTVYSDGDTINLPPNSSQIDVKYGRTSHSFDLAFKGNDVGSLIAPNSDGININFPESGEFAGEYTLNITDLSSGEVTTLTIVRPLRLSWSAKSILNGDTTQVLKIEGGAAGSRYSVTETSGSSLIFKNSAGDETENYMAENNPESFNAATIYLDSETTTDVMTMNVLVSDQAQDYADVVEAGIKVYPASTHRVSVVNEEDKAIGTALVRLSGNNPLLLDMNIPLEYSTDDQGKLTFILPDTSMLPVGSDFDVTVTADTYEEKRLAFNSDQTIHSVTLSELANSVTMFGTIRAAGNQDFNEHPPVVLFSFSDGSSESAVISVISSTEARFQFELDLNQKSFSTVSITQNNSVSLSRDVSQVIQSTNVDVQLVYSENEESVSPRDSFGGGSGGGTLMWWMIAVFGLLLGQRSKGHTTQRHADV